MAGSSLIDLVTLGFHKIGEPRPGGWPSWFYIPESTFAAQMQTLADLRCSVIDVACLTRHLRGDGDLPERPVLLTFDDGYESTRTAALPLLRERDYPAVLFVPTRFIGGANDFDLGVEPHEPICGWDDLRALNEARVSIQSHGISHTAFSALSPTQRKTELSESRRSLEDMLGTAVELFAYPYGDCGGDIAAAAALARSAGYRGAFLYGDEAPSSRSDSLRLPRVAMGPDTDLRRVLAERSWT